MKLLADHPKNSSTRYSSKGFTLLEILVVMAIILGLAGIGFSVFMSSLTTAKENETQAILNAVSEAMVARSADISSAQREEAAVGITAGFTFPDGDGSASSTENLVFYISGDFDGDGTIDVGAETKNSKIVPGASGSGSYLNSDGRIVDSWGNPIRYTFPGVYHNEDDGFDLESAGPDELFSGTNDDGKDAELDNIILK